jgi:hypothetical protein
MGLVIALWVLLSAASYWLLVLPRQHRFDFYPRWVGSRAVLAGENPYTQEVTWRIQEGMFGRRLEPGEDQQRFAYLATVAWILLPFLPLPFQLSVSLWCGLELLLLMTLPIAVAVLLKWQIRPLQMAVLLLFSVLVYRYPINAYLLGQFVPYALACLVGAWWGLIEGRPVAAILLLVGATIRPAVTLLPVLILLAAAWREKRRWVPGLWIGLLWLLWLVTRIRIGPWVTNFLGGIRAYAGYSFPRWPPSVLGDWWAAGFLVVGVLAWGGWMLVQVRSLPIRSRLPWEISTALLVALIVLPQTNNYTLIMGLLPAWVALWASKRRWLDWIPVLMVLTSPWVFYAARDSLPTGLEQLLIPLALGVLLTLRWRVWRHGRKVHRL